MSDGFLSPIMTLVSGRLTSADTNVTSAYGMISAVYDEIIEVYGGTIPSIGSPDTSAVTNPLTGWSPSAGAPDSPTEPDPLDPDDVPTLDLTTPGAPSVDIDEGITYYDSNLLATIRDKIIADLTDGGTGLSPDVETAIWDRDLEREEQAFQDAIDTMADHWAKNGFGLPDGVYATNLLALQKEYMNKRIDRSRDIAIKQAELEQNNIFKLIDAGVRIEAQIVDFTNNVAARVLDASKATAAALNQIYEIQVREQGNRVALFKEQVEAYTAGVSAITQRYNAEVEAFKSEIAAWTASEEMSLKALIGTAETDIKINAMEIQEWEAKVKKYAADIGAKVEAMKGVASLVGQAAAAAYVGASVNAHVGANDSASMSSSEIESTNTNYNYEM